MRPSYETVTRRRKSLRSDLEGTRMSFLLWLNSPGAQLPDKELLVLRGHRSDAVEFIKG